MLSVLALASEPCPGFDCVAVEGLVAVVREVSAPPEPTAETLAEQDARVRHLWRTCRAVLPVRFGQVVDDADALRTALGPRLPTLREALERVAGTAQVTLRVFGDDPALLGTPVALAPEASGPGARYLAARVQAARAAREVPVLAAVEARVADLVKQRRVRRGGRADLLATVYHLVVSPEEYLARVTEALRRVQSVRVLVSRPGPAYAFAPEDG